MTTTPDTPSRTPEQRDLARRVAERVATLADRTEDHARERLNMAGWGRTDPECGTAACLAGWTLLVEHGSFHGCTGRYIGDAAAALLGLTEREAYSLFEDGPVLHADVDTLREVTPAQASAVMMHLAETGQVDWSVARGI